MASYPPPGPGIGQRLEEAIELIEMELRHAIAYVNDAVVPEVRRESISAIRSLAEKMRKLADRLDRPPERPRNSPSSTPADQSPDQPQGSRL